jgi:hypothetical protein
MLTDEQITALLAVAAGYDNRRPGELNVAAWREASTRGRWNFPDAVEAIHSHYATKRDFLMPADVTTFVRAKNRQPAPVRELLGPSNPASAARVRAAVAEVSAKLGWVPDLHAGHPPQPEEAP